MCEVCQKLDSVEFVLVLPGIDGNLDRQVGICHWCWEALFVKLSSRRVLMTLVAGYVRPGVDFDGKVN